ncbi:hypothetical protein [Streptomyces sp. NPDC048428]|uniref:hypothetical protein n=1 Tax=Streptomyces sp. NPDC048428 TaxID=3154503 RepID=UPI003419463C
MSDFQDRRPAHRDPAGLHDGLHGQDGLREQDSLRERDGRQGRWRDHEPGPVHQAVFRWEGNQGRQGTGMRAVAHSCPADLADELGRELGSLLWVPGTAAQQKSVVRTRSADGSVMLVRRWPTTDRAGRPSTVSHVLIGDPRTLGTEQCLGLADGEWVGNRESAEKATGQLNAVEYARLDALVSPRLPRMTQRLQTVRRALILVAAAWLRDPDRRISLLTDGADPNGGLAPEDVPLLYLGAYRLFGSWLGRDWTFATYDTADTHQLRLMCVSRWEPDAGGSGPLARITGRTPGRQTIELAVAKQLVNHLLAHPAEEPGVPQLTGALRDGAALDWPQRRVLLEELLDTGRRHVPRIAIAPSRPPDADRAPEREPFPGPSVPTGRPDPLPEPLTPPPPFGPPAPSVPAASPYPGRPPVPRPAGPADGSPPYTRETTLREDLHAHRPENAIGRGLLAERLRNAPDELLLDELRSGALPQESVDLLLRELGDPRRAATRQESMRHELCENVLRNNLYFTPNRQGAEHISRTALAEQAAVVFTWAVAPLARDERYLRELQELVHRMCRDRHPSASNWIRQSITDPPSGRAPDLPPVVWQQLLRDMIRQNPAPAPPPPPPQIPRVPLSVSVSAPAPNPDFPSVTRESPHWWDRLTERTNDAGCVVSCAVGLIVVLIAVLFFFV